jgi:hypothetical protein
VRVHPSASSRDHHLLYNVVGGGMVRNCLRIAEYCLISALRMGG